MRELDMTKVELSAKADVSYRGLIDILSGVTNPRLDTLSRIVSALGLNMSEMTGAVARDPPAHLVREPAVDYVAALQSRAPTVRLSGEWTSLFGKCLEEHKSAVEAGVNTYRLPLDAAFRPVIDEFERRVR